MLKVSIIVPVYNVEKYLDNCLSSLVNQTLDDIEIIVINDGPTDRSSKIIEKYAKKSDKIKVYNKKNGGVSDARNYGLKKASGEYIGFVDSDDYVSKDMYEKMYCKAKESDFDVVVCDLNYVFEDGSIKRVSSHINKDTTNIKKTLINMYPCVWNKIYKLSLLKNKLEFQKGVWFEDVDFLYKLFPYVKTIGVIKEPFNQYVQRSGSITKTFDHRLYDYVKNFNNLIVFYQERDFYKKYFKELEYCYVRYLYASFIKQACHFSKKDYYEAVDTVIKNVNINFPKYRHNKYFYKSLKGLYLIAFNKTLAKIVYMIKRTKK